ncbi:unnamed protein product [Arabidopsis thaliana]|uniref:Uncharacterized protein n=1 Tax=Arabidopsis thaliana TaxID=3702 RepID=A0A654ELW6_ARATH|nr:unnamed protein product [Arabidopsis thaliana]
MEKPVNRRNRPASIVVRSIDEHTRENALKRDNRPNIDTRTCRIEDDDIGARNPRQSDIPARNADFVNWTFLLVFPTVPARQTPVNLKAVNPRIPALNCQLINPTVPPCRLLNCQPDSSCSSTDNTSSNYHIELVFKLLNSSLSLLARLQALHIS